MQNSNNRVLSNNKVAIWYHETFPFPVENSLAQSSSRVFSVDYNNKKKKGISQKSNGQKLENNIRVKKLEWMEFLILSQQM